LQGKVIQSHVLNPISVTSTYSQVANACSALNLHA